MHSSLVTKARDLPLMLADKEFRKANEVIAPRVARGGTLSLLGRKVFNVLLYHTQRLGSPGLGAPKGDPVYKTLYWLPLSELAKDAAFHSEDTGLLKETLLKLQDIKIITDNNKGFSSDVLVASIKIIPGKGGQKTMLGWGLHPATEAILRSPEFYTRLSIYYLTSLRTTASVALYENAKRYATNPSKLTRRESWEWWHDVLTGQPLGRDKPEYKYFKRDVLKPAIAEINTTDIVVELIEHKVGRRIAELQFRVERVARKTLELSPPSVIDTQVMARIMALGILRRESEDICASNDEGFLKITLDLVEARSADQKLPPLASSAAFFRTALRGRFAEAQRLRSVTKPLKSEKQAETEALADLVALKDQKVKLKQFDALPEKEKQELIERFIKCHPVFAQFVKKPLNSRVGREALAQWLFKSNPAPTGH